MPGGSGPRRRRGRGGSAEMGGRVIRMEANIEHRRMARAWSHSGHSAGVGRRPEGASGAPESTSNVEHRSEGRREGTGPVMPGGSGPRRRRGRGGSAEMGGRVIRMEANIEHRRMARAWSHSGHSAGVGRRPEGASGAPESTSNVEHRSEGRREETGPVMPVKTGKFTGGRAMGWRRTSNAQHQTSK